MISKTIVLFVTAVSTSLIGGLFYAYACSVTLGLGRLSDAAYLSAMQSINRAILNPLFFAGFMGTLLLLPVSTYMSYDGSTLSLRFWLLLGATVMYAAGVFGVTMFGNVPMNELLDKLDLKTLTPAEIAEQRKRFEGPWNALNNIRTAASFLAIVLVIWACLVPENLTHR
jgi:uncharacterized membrane protein